MFEEYYAEQVIRNREWERARVVAMHKMQNMPSAQEERAVLSTGWSGWSWDRARAVLAVVTVAVAASVALPASLQGAAWGLREILELVIR